jgi:hypothetical protein
MTSVEPSEPEKQSIDEFLVENTNATPEDLEQAKKEAERDARRRQREREREKEDGEESIETYDPTEEFDN